MNLGPGLGSTAVDPIGLGCRPQPLFVANSGPIWLARVPLTLEAAEGGRQHHVCVSLQKAMLNTRLQRIITISSAYVGKVFMCSFKGKEAILDDMFTSAVMQNPFDKHLKEVRMNFTPLL